MLRKLIIPILTFVISLQYASALSGATTPATYKSIASIQRPTTILEDYLNTVDAKLNSIRDQFATISILSNIVDLVLNVIRSLYALLAPLHGITNIPSGNYKHFCTGIIINNNNILTTANCVNGKSAADIRIKVGVSDWGSSATLLEVSSIKPHLNFSLNNYFADVALLKLSENLIFNSTVQQANMPQSLSASDFNLFAAVTTSGSILSFNTDPRTPPGGELMSANIVITAYKTCSANLDGQSDPTYDTCAKSSSAGVCLADEGAPIITSFNGQEYVYALSLRASFQSSNDECADTNVPVMFLKMSSLSVTYFIIWQT